MDLTWFGSWKSHEKVVVKMGSYVYSNFQLVKYEFANVAHLLLCFCKYGGYTYICLLLMIWGGRFEVFNFFQKGKVRVSFGGFFFSLKIYKFSFPFFFLRAVSFYVKIRTNISKHNKKELVFGNKFSVNLKQGLERLLDG